jgi:hypothetical protein
MRTRSLRKMDLIGSPFSRLNNGITRIWTQSGRAKPGRAKWIADDIAATLKRQDRFTIALSGGSTPKLLHEILAAAPYKDQIDWSKLHIFWGMSGTFRLRR